MDDEILHKNKKLNDKYEFLKRTLQFVFSVSAFSLFVWYSSGFSILPQSFNAYFSTCLLSMLAHTLERKYMFLICNLILAFLAKISLFTSSSSLPPPTSPYDDLESQPSNNNEYDLSYTYNKEPVSEEVAFPLPSFRLPEKASPIVVEEQLDEQVKTQLEEFDHERAVSEAAQGEEHGGTLVTQTEGGENDEASIAEEKEEEAAEEYINGGDGEEGETGSGVMAVKRDDDDDEELANTTMATNELELANTEELNKKFEEFIRKMKEEIRIEAQTQPIAV